MQQRTTTHCNEDSRILVTEIYFLQHLYEMIEARSRGKFRSIVSQLGASKRQRALRISTSNGDILTYAQANIFMYTHVHICIHMYMLLDHSKAYTNIRISINLRTQACYLCVCVIGFVENILQINIRKQLHTSTKVVHK